MSTRIWRLRPFTFFLGRPVAFGAGKWPARQPHSASDRSLWYAFLMLGILPSKCLSTPFQTVSLRSSRKLAKKGPKDSSFGGCAWYRWLLAWWPETPGGNPREDDN